MTARPEMDAIEVSTGWRIARLEGRMNRIEDKLDRLTEWIPIAVAFTFGTGLGWVAARMSDLGRSRV